MLHLIADIDEEANSKPFFNFIIVSNS